MKFAVVTVLLFLALTNIASAEICSKCGDDVIIPRINPDIKDYKNEKTDGSGFCRVMDFALLITNVEQLRRIMKSSERNLSTYIKLSLVIFSIILQIVLGVLLLFKSQYDVSSIVNKITIVLPFLTAVNYVFLKVLESDDLKI